MSSVWIIILSIMSGILSIGLLLSQKEIKRLNELKEELFEQLEKSFKSRKYFDQPKENTFMEIKEPELDFEEYFRKAELYFRLRALHDAYGPRYPYK